MNVQNTIRFISAAATPLATIVRYGRHWFCVFKHKVQAYLGVTDFPLVLCISNIVVKFICHWHIKRSWCFFVIFLSHCGSLCSVLNTSHHSSFPSTTFLFFCQDNKRMRRTLEEEQRARKELEKIVRRVLKNMDDPTWDETNLWDQCVSDCSKRDQTNLWGVVQSEQKLPTLYSSYSDSEWTFMRNQTLNQAEVPSQLTVMLWGQSAGRHDEITSRHVLLTSFETVTNYLRSLIYFDIVHSTQHSKVFLTNSSIE